MSVTLETHFVESKSTDPVERAIARKVIRILNDQTLDRQQRESLVKKAQRELLRHQQQVRQRQLLEQAAAKAQLPKGFRAISMQVQDGQMHLGASHKKTGFVWIPVGQAPQGVTSRHACALPTHAKSVKRKGKEADPIATRRRELALSQ